MRTVRPGRRVGRIIVGLFVPIKEAGKSEKSAEEGQQNRVSGTVLRDDGDDFVDDAADGCDVGDEVTADPDMSSGGTSGHSPGHLSSGTVGPGREAMAGCRAAMCDSPLGAVGLCERRHGSGMASGGVAAPVDAAVVAASC
jgi:hypothetical protein